MYKEKLVNTCINRLNLNYQGLITITYSRFPLFSLINYNKAYLEQLASSIQKIPSFGWGPCTLSISKIPSCCINRTQVHCQLELPCSRFPLHGPNTRKDPLSSRLQDRESSSLRLGSLYLVEPKDFLQ